MAQAPPEVPGPRVTRTQWLDLSSLEMVNLVGKRVLIVDEVDDTRTTLEYAVRELLHDVREAARRLGRAPDADATQFAVFVLHNKDKAKKGALPSELVHAGRYLAAETVPDVWICYPWEAMCVTLLCCLCCAAGQPAPAMSRDRLLTSAETSTSMIGSPPSRHSPPGGDRFPGLSSKRAGGA